MSTDILVKEPYRKVVAEGEAEYIDETGKPYKSRSTEMVNIDVVVEDHIIKVIATHELVDEKGRRTVLEEKEIVFEKRIV